MSFFSALPFLFKWENILPLNKERIYGRNQQIVETSIRFGWTLFEVKGLFGRHQNWFGNNDCINITVKMDRKVDKRTLLKLLVTFLIGNQTFLLLTQRKEGQFPS